MLQLGNAASGAEPFLYWLSEDMRNAYAQRVALTPAHRGLYRVHLSSHNGYDVDLPGLYVTVGGTLIRYQPPGSADVERASLDMKSLEAELHRLDQFAYNPAHERTIGLGDPEALERDLIAIHANFLRYGHSYSLGIFDVDEFKAYSQMCGQDAAQDVLESVAQTIAKQARTGDSAYRMGGDRFAIIFPFQRAQLASIGAERIRRAVAALAIPYPRSACGVLTLSAGVTEARVGQVTMPLEEAENALRDAKQVRNHVGVHRMGVEVTAGTPDAPAAAHKASSPRAA